jgi:hypothetical protein
MNRMQTTCESTPATITVDEAFPRHAHCKETKFLKTTKPIKNTTYVTLR